MADSPPQQPSPEKRSRGRPRKSNEELLALRGPDHKLISEKEEVSDLPRWARLAIAEFVNVGGTYADIAQKYGKSKSALAQYSASPAGLKWRAQLAEVADSPEKVSMAMMRASAAAVTMDYLMALEMAVESGDYKEIGVISRDLLDRLGMKREQKANKQAAPSLTINLNGASLALDMPTVESTAIEVLDAELIDEDGEDE